MYTITLNYQVSEHDFNEIVKVMHGPPTYGPTSVSGPGHESSNPSGGRGAAPQSSERATENTVVIDFPAPSFEPIGFTGAAIRDLLQKSVGAAAASLAWEQSFRRALWIKAGRE